MRKLNPTVEERDAMRVALAFRIKEEKDAKKVHICLPTRYVERAHLLLALASYFSLFVLSCRLLERKTQEENGQVRKH